MAMITIFAIPKPFIGGTAIHQKNAIKSWISAIDDVEIILYGDEIGIDNVAKENNLIHISHVKKNQYGTPYLDEIFFHVQKHASSDHICYLNCDIILTSNPLKLIKKIPLTNFLISGRRVNLDINYQISFDFPDEIYILQSQAIKSGELDSPYSMDYFIFPKNQISMFPPFVVGRLTWDVWMIWAHKYLFNVPVIDATESFLVIHQNHGYSHITYRYGNNSDGIESDSNRKFFNKEDEKFFNILDSEYIFSRQCGLEVRKINNQIRIHRLKRGILSKIGEKNYKQIKLFMKNFCRLVNTK